MYDEPFSGLDPISMGMVLRLIKRTTTCLGVTSVVVSHDVEEIIRIADLLLRRLGRERDRRRHARRSCRKSDSPLIRQFMSGEADGPVPFHYPAAPYQDELLGGRS